MAFIGDDNIHKNKIIFKEKRYKNAEQEIENKYNRLTIIDIDYDKTEYEYSMKHYYGVFMKCKCDCGNVITTSLYHLKEGYTKSCGCLSKEKISKYNVEHKSKINKYDLSREYGIGWTYNSGEKFYFDLDDYDKIKDICWVSTIIDKNCGYKRLNGRYKGKVVTFYKLITDYDIVDHKNRNTLDNRKQNLRNATKSQNCQNHNLRTDSTTGISGVNWHKKSNKWQVRINDKNNKRISLGIYSDFNEAVKVRLKAEKKYYGEYAPQRHLFEKYGIT